GDSKSTLFTLDMSEITLSGAFSTAFQNFVQDFTALTTVNLPNEGISEAVSLYMTFSGCTSLTTVTNLDKLTQIRSFLYTFRYCSSLETITLSEGTTYSSIDLTNTFDGCSNLKTINNFEKFTNISCLVCTFQNCSSLLEVRFGTDPNTLGNTYSNIGWTFDGTNPDCIKYLPSGVTDVPTYWTDTKKYTNFAVPITLSDITAPDAIVTGESLTLPSTPSISPTYAARQNLKWEIKKADETGWSEYTTGTALDYSYNGALLRYSAQPYDVDTENPESTTSNEVEIIVEAMYLYFDVNEGDSEATEISVTYNSEIGSLPVVTKEGYEFIAWTIDNDTITEETIWQYKEDKTAVAQWTVIEYGITYNLDGGINDASNPENYTIETATITLADATRTGYSFEGWYDAETDGNRVTEIATGTTGDVVLYAQWTINSYNVVAIANDGGTATVNGEEAANVNYGETAEFVAVADEDYIFVSWTNEDGEVVSEEETYTITVTYDLSLTANFVEAATSVSNVTNSNIVVSTNNNIITITGAEIGTKISIYTVNGSIIYNGTITSDVNYIPMNTTGLLLIKVDNYITKTIN
ncbi:MAG: InlB B-repeat-containing protein, partial [bacterium]